MATITKPNTFSAGAVIVASEHNSNFDTIYDDYNGGITNANISGSAAIVDTKLATITTASKVNASAFVITSEAQGDITYRNATVWTRLAAGTANFILKTGGASANPSWVICPTWLSFGDANVAQNVTVYIMPMHPTQTATEANARAWKAPTAATLKNLRVTVQTAPGGTDTFIATVFVNNAVSTLTATITGTAVTASDTSNTVAVTAGQTVYLRVVTSATAAASAIWSATVEASP